ncbi:MAG: isopeptide-forming domain-containing fimbrial protein [Clostridia bacterium]|nr:isopeptide-forming domain-containing fimbrial protein [Clostridia bacterium]
MSISVSAFADAKITISNTQPDRDETAAAETYTAYKIFDAVKSTGTTIITEATYTEGTLPQSLSEGGAITYTIGTNSAWFSKLFTESGTTATATSGNTYFTATYIPSGDYKVGETTYHTYQITATSSMSTEAHARACAAWLLGLATAEDSGISGTVLTGPSGTETSYDNIVEDGYYLVTSSLGTNLGLATTDMPMTVVEKNKFPSIDKKQNDKGVNETYADDPVNVQVGDTIYYELVVYVPASASGDITVTDTLSTGLTFNYTAGSTFTFASGNPTNTSIADPGITTNAPTSFTGTVTEDETGTAHDWKVDGTPNTNTFTIKIHPTAATKGKFIQIKFPATVNASALTETDRKNEVKLTYSNYSQSDSVEYDIYAAAAVKFDGSTVKHDGTNLDLDEDKDLQKAKDDTAIKYLANAEFKLQVKKTGESAYSDLAVVEVTSGTAGIYRPVVTGETGVTIKSDSNGHIVIRGLDSDNSYQLVETKAPEGYNLLTTPISLDDYLTKEEKTVTVGEKTTIYNTKATSFTAPDDSDTTTVQLIPAKTAKIENNAGTVLPSTGGIGTTIFYVVGSILVIAAGVLLITKKRMSREG